jgi:hypothetical protein
MLMPAYYQTSEVNTAETRTALPQNLKDYIRKLDRAIKAASNNTYGVCNPRINLIAGGYGNPLNPAPLPIRAESGKLAGTVGGELVALSQVRTELCK